MTTDRRGFLKASAFGAAGAASLALVGCGDDSSSGNSSLSTLATATSAVGVTPTVVDPFAGVKKGGTYKNTITGDPPAIDPYANFSFQTKITAAYVYSRLFMYKTGPGIGPTDFQSTGDLVETVEHTPDGLKWTMHLRKGVKFHNVAPVNGRDVTSDDVKFSWGRATDPKNTNGPQFTTVVDKVEYPDASTLVFTLKAPSAAFQDLLSDPSLLVIMPVEAEGKFNPATQMIGSGPWMLDKYTPSVSLNFKKNPNWWVTGFPLMDAVQTSIIPEYATRLAQFQAGSTDLEGLTVSDVIDFKKNGSKTPILASPSINLSMVYFDGNDPNNPWAKDDRVRQAVSQSLDRDALTDLIYSVKALAAAGVQQNVKWNNSEPIGQPRWWLDPKSKDQGDSAQFFNYDPANAKKLLAAAGYPDGFSTTYQYTPVYGPPWTTPAEANISYFSAIGVKTTTDVQDYVSKYSTHTFAGDFKGMGFGPESSFSDPGSYPNRWFADNPLNHGRIKDPALAKLATQQAQELDPAKRKELLWEIQRQNAQHMYYVPHQAGAGNNWLAYQPAMHNVDVYRSVSYAAGTETIPYFWRDA